MSTVFTEADYRALAAIVFLPDYPGNATARGVVEAPNGDGKLDATKRYAHVATKYLDKARGALTIPDYQLLCGALLHAHEQAVQVATAWGVQGVFLPCFNAGALRVLKYPAGAGSAVHTDFDLFTLNLYRNVPNPGLGGTSEPVHMGELGELLGLGPARRHHVEPLPVVQRSIVYFAIPDHAAVLPSGQTVGDWIAARIARSRVVTEVAK